VISHSEDLFLKNNLTGPEHIREDTVILRRAPLPMKFCWTSSISRGHVVCVVARSSIRTGCTLCAYGEVSVCLCVCLDMYLRSSG
jgi:hypothetical protein